MRERAQTLLAQVAYKDGTGFRVTEKSGLVLLQHWQILPCSESGTSAPTQQMGRKWYLSEHMLDEEILQTALLAALTFEEHEAREAFRFNGRKLFGPHKALPVLVQDVEVHRE